MKKVNVYFIGECIIIILLLAILGVLLKSNGADAKNISAEEIAMEETMAEEAVQNSESVSAEEEVYSGIQNVADVIRGQETMEVSGNTIEGTTVSGNQMEESAKGLEGKKIVVFGDSIWNSARGEDGVSEQLAELTGSIVYNCAVGGTSAAVVGESTDFSYDWRSKSFNGMVHVANKLLPADVILAETDACEVIKQVDFSTVDYLLVSYGLNDYFSDVSIYPNEYYDIATYVGALRNGILHFRENYPQAKIVLVTPTYTKVFEGERQHAIGEYVEGVKRVSQDMNTELIDVSFVLGDDMESRVSHLEDGVHLSAEGRSLYAKGIAEYLTQIEMAN